MALGLRHHTKIHTYTHTYTHTLNHNAIKYNGSQVPDDFPGGAPLAAWRWDSGIITREQFEAVPKNLRTANGGSCAQCARANAFKVCFDSVLFLLWESCVLSSLLVCVSCFEADTASYARACVPSDLPHSTPHTDHKWAAVHASQERGRHDDAHVHGHVHSGSSFV